MTAEFWLALGRVAPVYNLALVIAVVYLFFKLFTTPPVFRTIYVAPWKFMFFALCIFILEELITVLRQANLVSIPLHINGFFELIIISIFLYALLLQKEHVTEKYG